MLRLTCPDVQRLSDYLAGKLSDDEMDLLDRHLASCDPCCAAAAGFDGENAPADNEIRRLLRMPDDFRIEDDPELLAALETVLRLGTTPGSPGRPLEVPAMIGEFEIIAPLGQGVLDMVYKARHARRGTTMAIKLLAPGRLDDAETGKRFEEEMKALGPLNHPDIVKARYSGEANGVFYQAMEYIEGFDLARLVELIGESPAADDAEIVRQACATTGEGLGPDTTSMGPADVVPGGGAGPVQTNLPAKTGQHDKGPVPATIGRYIVRRQLGTGGFGTVWLADDAELQRQVAVKVPRPSRLTNEAGLASFLHEARTAARLKHPAIVTIHDVGRLDAIGCFVVMEFISGRSLAEEIKIARPVFERSAVLMEQVAEAVHYAHEQGLVHRDLKPANILLDTADKPRVVDFGLAIHEEYRPGRRGEVSGTPAYMAPEQVRGESHRLDGRTDVWSLGVVLYELLAGRRPFVAPSADLLFEEIQHRDPTPPRQIDEAVPVELERICLKCLAKRMTDRYATAADLAADLRHWQEEGGGEKGKRRGGDTDRGAREKS